MNELVSCNDEGFESISDEIQIVECPECGGYESLLKEGSYFTCLNCGFKFTNW